MTTPTNPNHPVATVRDGALKIAIFANESADGKTRYSGQLTRSYTDANGDWKETRSLSGSEYLRAALLLEQAYREEIRLRSESRANNQGDSGARP